MCSWKINIMAIQYLFWKYFVQHKSRGILSNPNHPFSHTHSHTHTHTLVRRHTLVSRLKKNSLLNLEFHYLFRVRRLEPTFIGVGMMLEVRKLTRTLIFSQDFLKNLLKNLLQYILPLFVCPWKRHILYCLDLF